MYEDERRYYLYEFCDRWGTWSSLNRADAVARLRNEGFSLRKLAKIAGCSEGTIRNYEILYQMPDHWQQVYVEGQYSMRQLVTHWRAEQKRLRDEDGDD
jgi:hypothetical protein